MLRLCVIQSVNRAVSKLNISENRFSTKCVNNLMTSNETVGTKDTSTLQDTPDSNIDGNVYKEIKNKNAALKEQQDSKLSEINELEFVNKVMVNIKSSSIFGSKTVDNCGIHYVKNNKDLEIPSVTCILSETMSSKVKIALEKWKKNIIDMYGEEYFKKYCKGLLDSGKLFHFCVQKVLSNKGTEIPCSIKLVYDSIEPLLNDIQTVHGFDINVIHPTLRYKGIIDCIATYRGHTYLIDWKKSERQETSLATTYDAPIQVAAYIGAFNAFNKYPFKIDRGLIVVAYTNGEPASIYELKDDVLQTTWGGWLNRLEQFYVNYKKDSLNT